MVPTSKMLQLILCIDGLFEHFMQSANKLTIKVQNVSQKSTLDCPYLLTKAIGGLFKYDSFMQEKNCMSFEILAFVPKMSMLEVDLALHSKLEYSNGSVVISTIEC